MSMTPEELTICREIHAGLTSRERSSISYLFLEPVDPTNYPTYLSIVKRPMDLRTLSQNLENGTYSTKEEFYVDARLIFDNAILFNKDVPESKFVCDLAKRMMKAFDRVRKNAEKKAARLAGNTGTSGGGSGNKNQGGSASGGSDQKKAAAAASGEQGGGEKKKKLSIKLKRQNSTISPVGGVSSSKASSTNDSSAGVAGEPAKKKAKLKLKVSSTMTLDASAKVEKVPMDSTRRAQCYKVITSLKRQQPSNCKWFARPVSDPMIVKDYKEKIKNPADISSMTSKLDKNQYSTVDEFVLDLRRIASNCLQYNTTVNDSFRPVAVEFLTLAEDLCKFFIAKPELPKVVYPCILYCWADCVRVLSALINIKNADDEHQSAWFFLHPVTYFCGGVYPEGYTEKVKKPIDFGTIVQNLITGHYTSVAEFAADCRGVVENCRTFYAGDDDGAVFIEKANRLSTLSMEKNLAELLQLDQSDKVAKAREKAASKFMVIKRPEPSFLRNIMQELRAATYTDKASKISEKATLYFEKPVDTKMFTDYRQFVETPMDLETVDGKIESGSYVTPEDFEYDMSLIFKNCERYNGPKKNIHMLNLGKHTSKLFRKLFAERMRGGTKRPSVLIAPPGGKKALASPAAEERAATKRVSIKAPSRKASKSLSTSSSGKSAPKFKPGKKFTQSPSKITPAADPNAAVPMHIAIASIKESYPGRRKKDDLEQWENECAILLCKLFKHPWITPERPKYIFHVPVHIIFPNIRESYAAKVDHPMDLTTAEAKLLQGVYQNAEEFLSDISLVFTNAIAFNEEGRGLGESMSCAYYDVSTHLLQYIRWLSLETLQSSLVDCLDSPVVESGSEPSWKLTHRNREMARKEMESIVFNALLDKTEEGDNYSWSEKECQNLQRSLLHSSDRKNMMFFLHSSTFPADYTAFISRPMAHNICQDKLKKRRYNTFGEVVADLRLIFSNALKYNEGARHICKISGEAYDSAIHMSGRLEAAIDKMLVTVSDRIGRDRIDLITSRREMEAKQRAEEEQQLRQWEQQNPGSTMEVKTKLRIVHQRSHRRKMTDFEFPFYDEDDNQEESHAESLQHAKALYEKQREARAAMQEMALSISISVFQRHKECAAAQARAHQIAQKARMERIRIEKEKADAERAAKAAEALAKEKGDCVSTALNDSNRKQIKMKMAMQTKSRKSRKGLCSFD